MPYSTADGGNKGIDISAPRGTPIYAAGAGKVVYVGNQLRGYGNLIMIKHSEDYITAYAHNDTMLVNNGQSVKVGQNRHHGEHGCGICSPAFPDSLPCNGN